MSCQAFEERLDDFLEGRMSAAERRVAEQHLAGCTPCSILVDAVRASLVMLGEERDALAPMGAFATPTSIDADLAGAIVARTSGAACGRAQEQLCDLADGLLDSEPAQLVQMHLEHCDRCSALYATVLWLQHELPRLALVEPDAQLTTDVLAAVAPLRRRRQGWLSHVRQGWSHLLERPRFVWEAAYVGTLLLVLLFGTSVSPFRGVPTEALAIMRVEPLAAITTSSRQLVSLHDAIGTWSGRAWHATGGRAVGQVGEWGDDYAGRHPGFAESTSSLRAHGSELQHSIRGLDFVRTSLVVNAMGHDLGTMWHSMTAGAPADSTDF